MPDRPVAIFLTDTMYRRYWDRIAAVAPHATAVRLLADGTRVGELDGAEVAWGTPDVLADGLGRKFFGGVIHTPTFRWMQASGAGHDDPFYGRFVATGAVLTAAHVNSVPIAEYIAWAVLDHTLLGPRWRDHEARHEWGQAGHAEVRGQTWTIVGYGSIGRAVTPLAHALGATVRGVRRTPAADDPADEMFTTARLHEAVSGADVVALAAPLDASTAGMADDAFFAAMSPGALLVNVGRGGLVDEGALLRALDRGTPGAAVLDVASVEPTPPEHPFWSHPGITFTPHIAGWSDGNDDRLAELFVSNLQRYLAGEPMPHTVTAADVGLSS